MTTREQDAFLRSLEEEKEEPARRAAAKRARFVRPLARVAGGGGLTVTIARAAGQNNQVNAGPINFTVTFNKPATGFTNSDVSFAGSTVGGTLAAAVTGTGPYNVAVTGMTGNGIVRVSIPAGAATDASGAPFPAAVSATVMFDTTGPGVTINKAAGQADPADGGPVNFTVIFDQPVSGFVSSDVSLTGTTAGGTLLVTVTGSGATYNVAVSGILTAGNVVASIPAGAATDLAGNLSLASTSTDNIIATFAFPDATTTGPQVGTVFTVTSGEIRSTADNQVIQNLDHTGYILVMHNNVTVRNCRINAQNNSRAIERTAGQGTKILNCEMFGNIDVMTDPSNHCDIAIELDDDATSEVGFCNIYHVGNGMNCYNTNIHDNYFHDFVDRILPGGDDFHVDGVQTFNASGFGGMIVRHNTIISISTAGQYTPVNFAGGTSCVISSPGQFAETFDSNLLAGGAFSIYGPNHSGGTPAVNMVVTNNRFSTKYFPQCGAFGPYTGFDPAGVGFVWSGNVFHESGLPVTNP